MVWLLVLWKKGVRKTHVLQGTEHTENKYLAIYALHFSYKILC